MVVEAAKKIGSKSGLDQSESVECIGSMAKALRPLCLIWAFFVALAGTSVSSFIGERKGRSIICKLHGPIHHLKSPWCPSASIVFELVPSALLYKWDWAGHNHTTILSARSCGWSLVVPQL